MPRHHLTARKMWLWPLAVLLALATAGLVAAAPLDPSGDPDPSFGGNGQALANFATVYSFAGARAAAMQSNGKIVLAGESVDNGQTHIALVRLNTDGLQDRTFGAGGEVKLQVGSTDLINDVAIQSDQKIVAVGFSSLTVNVFTIARFLPDGALDTGFGGGAGYVTVDFQGATSNLNRANAVAIQDDGKIVVAGYRRDNTAGAGGDDVALVRLNTDGTLDSSFGSGGKVITAVAAGTGSDQAWDVQVIGSGAGRKILIGGRTRPSGGQSTLLLARYTSNGTLDGTFGTGGVSNIDIPGNGCWPQGSPCGDEVIRAIALQADGKIVATGSWGTYATFPSTSGSTDTEMLTARFTATGALDTTFASTGYVITSVARGYYTDIGLSVAVQPDGKIVSFGYTDQSSDFPAFVSDPNALYYNQNFLFVRLNADGSRDSGFGPSPPGTDFPAGTVVPPGVVVVDLSEEGKTYDNGYAVVIDGQGRLVGAGRRTYADGVTQDTYIGAARLNTDGSVDYTFGPDLNTTGSLNGVPDGVPDGYFYTQMLGGSIDSVGGIALQPDNKLVVAGSTNIGGSQTRVGLARFNVDGSLDSDFSGDGLATAGVAGMTSNTASAAAVQADGKIVTVGESYGPGAPVMTVMRFSPAGALDTGFDGDGIATTTFGTNGNSAFAVAVQGDGKLLVGGSVSDTAGNWDFGLARFTAAGALDTGFGTGGKVRLDIGTGQNYDEIHAILVQPDGKILLGGASNSSATGSRFALTRLNANGSADSTFNGGSPVITRLSHSSNPYASDQIRALALMDDGRIVAAGKALNDSTPSSLNAFALARYTPGGALDTSFGSAGTRLFNVAGNTLDEILGMALQHDEKIVAVGSTLSLAGGGSDVLLARFNWDNGALDSTYASGGYVTTNFAGNDYPANAEIMGDGRIVLGVGPGSADFAAMRYLGDPAPTTPSAPDLTAASDSGRSNSDNITNDSTPTFAGTCVTGETVVLTVDGSETSPISRAICYGGAYTVTAASPVSDGTHSFRVLARNGAGDSAATSVLSVEVDTVAQPPTISAPAAASKNLPNPTISGAGAEPDADVAITQAGSAVCSGRSDTAGAWSCATTLGPGSYTIAARQTDVAGNTSSPTTRSFVVKAPTTTTLTSALSTTVYGQSAVFTAVVTSDYGTPNGTVEFVIDGGAPIPATLSGGTATLSRSSLAVGAHTVTANYLEATLYFGSSASPLAHTVIKADTTTSLSSSANPSVFGQPVTLTASVTAVAPGAGIPGGTVTFKDSDQTIGTAVLNGAGQASITTAGFDVGAHSITAEYAGDVNFNGSATAASLGQIVNKASTSTTTVSSLNPSVYGQAVTFTATVTVVAPGAGTPVGTVTFRDGAATLGTAPLNSAGSATLTTSALLGGGHAITAEYAGDASFSGSVSPAVSQTVNRAATSTALGASPSAATYGNKVTLTATITSSAGTPGGTVTFKDGTATLGAATLEDGVATIITSAIDGGARTLTAEYGGDTNFAPSVSPGVAQTMSPAPATIVLASSSNPGGVLQPITFSATVTSGAPGTPSGTVTFKNGGATLGSGALNGSGQASFTTTDLGFGTHSITAEFGGDTRFAAGTSAALEQAIVKNDTTTVVGSSAAPSVFGQPVTLTATVAFGGVGTPTGTVTFREGGSTLGTAALDGSGQASITTASLTVGTHAITAEYAGDASFDTSTSGAFSQVVGQATTATAMTSSPEPSLFGQPVTLTASVAVTAPGAGSPGGTVTFRSGAETLGTATLDASGTASLVTSGLRGGAHTLTAEYGGDVHFAGSSSAATSHTVQRAATTTSLDVAPATSVYGQAVVLTATVSSGTPGIPGGTVTFRSGPETLGTATLGTTGTATLTVTTMGVGARTLTAEYAGDTDFAGSTSAGESQVVGQAATATSLASSADPSVFGQSVTFTATVTAVAPGAGIPTGTVTFKDGAATLGTATLDANGVATLTGSGLSVGGHSITAEFGGDTDFAGSTSAGESQVVGQAATATSLASSADPSVFGQPVTFTATVTAVAPGAGIPTGTVTFKDGAATLGTAALDASGGASVTAVALAGGEHEITAVYAGDASFGNSASASLNQLVTPAATTTGLSSSTPASVYGDAVTLTAVVTSAAGTPGGTVTFMDGAATLGSATLDAGGQAVLTTTAIGGGSRTITAVYAGSADFAASSSPAVTQTVSPASTSAALTSSTNPSLAGQAVMFTATLTSPAGTPAGTVTFKNGAATLATVQLDAGGQASFTTAALTVGSHAIAAEYAGSQSFAASSDSLVQVVEMSADLSGSGAASPTHVIGAGTLSYTFVVANDGPSEADSVGLSVTLPAAVTVSALPSGCTVSSVAVTCALGTLTSGARITETLSVMVPGGVPSGADLTAAWLVTSTTADPDPSDNSGQAVAIAGAHQVFLPMVAGVPPLPDAPDLVVTSFTVTSTSVEIVIRNQGTLATTSGFWVDLYVAPEPAPTGPNQIWQDGRSSRGAVWGVSGRSLAPGAELRLTLNDTYYIAAYSRLEALAAGTVVYVQVDSANADTSYGAVLETHELAGLAYNNIAVTTVAAGGATAAIPSTAARVAGDDNLPRRPNGR